MGGGGGSPWGAAITSISAGLQAIVGNKAYQNAWDAQKLGAQQGMDTRSRQYKETQGYLDPYYQQGMKGLNRASDMISSGYQFNSDDPGFAFRMAEGQKALERSASSRGNLLGGAQQKALANYSQGLASQEYGNSFNRAMGLANMGYGAAGQMAGYSNQFGNAQSGAQEGLGNAEAANIMSKYQNWQNLDTQAAGAWSGYFRGSGGGGNGSSQNTAGNYGSSLGQSGYGNYGQQNNANPGNFNQSGYDWSGGYGNQIQDFSQSQKAKASATGGINYFSKG